MYMLNTVVKEKNGNRLSSCRFCEKTFSGSHGRHVAHFDPTDMSIITCEKAPEGVLNHVSSILQDKLTKLVSKKHLHDLAQLASADRTAKKQQKIDHICNSFSRDEVDNKICRAFISAGIPFNAIDNDDVKAWSKARGLATASSHRTEILARRG